MNRIHWSFYLASVVLSLSTRPAPVQAASVQAASAQAAPSEVNLNLMANRAIPAASDSIEGRYQYMAGAYADDKADTAWVTGRDMREHWAQVEWFRTDVTIDRIELDFTPVTLEYQPQKMFGEREAPAAQNITTVKPETFQIEAFVQAEWKTVHALAAPVSWQGDKATIKLPQPLSGVTRLRLRFNSRGTQDCIGLREWQVWGPKTASSFTMRPKWKGSWLWGEREPQLANFSTIKRYLRRVFEAPAPAQIVRAKLLFSAHDRGDAWLNGTRIAHTANTGPGMNRVIARVDVDPALFKAGKNVLALEGEDMEEVGLRGVLAELWVEKRDGTTDIIATEPNGFQASTFPRPGWNSSVTGFDDWAPAQRLQTPNSEVKWAWTADYTPAYFSGAVQVTGVELKPQIPKEGEAFTLTVGVKAERQLDDQYGLIAEYGDAGPGRVSYVDYGRGEGFIAPENGLPKGFRGEKKLTLSGVWTRGVTPRLPIFLRFVNPKQQLQIVPGPVGQVTEGEQPNRLRVDVGVAPVKYAKAGFAEAKIPAGGRLSIDGQLVAPMMYSASLQNPERYIEYLKTGVKLYRIVPQGASTLIPDEGEEDTFFGRLLECIRVQTEAIHSVDPEAKFILFLDLDMPQSWKVEHPEETIVLGNDTRLIASQGIGNNSLGYIQETPNAPAVLERMRTCVRDFFGRLQKEPYASSIFGVALAHGRAGENYWGLDNNTTKDENGDWIIPPRAQYFWGDFGIAARRHFRDWLKARYGTKENLQKAWKIENLDFEDVTNVMKWPTSRFENELMWRKRPAGRFMFRDRTAEGSLFHDFAEHMNESRAELFMEAGKVIKEVSHNRLLVGGYIGYVVPALTNSPPGSAQHAGHLAMRRILDSPYIDMLFSPHFYHMRRQGDPIMPMGITDSLRLHNKLWINEYDSRSYLSPISPKTFSQRETLEVFQKEFGNAITRDQGWWWLEFNFNNVGQAATSWFADEKMQADANTMKRVYDRYLSLPPTGPGAEIAVFVNVEQPYYTDAYSPGNTVHSNIVNQLIPRLSMLGAPFDLYAQADLPKLKERGWLKNYKMVLFLNAFHLDGTERSIIESDLKKDGKTLLFFFAPGYQGNDDAKSELSLHGIETVTGLQGVQKLAESHVIGLHIEDNPLLKDVKEREFDAITWWGKEQVDNYGNPIGPVFYLDQAKANGWQTLATLRLDQKNDATKIALAQLKTPTYTSIYSVIPDLPAEVLSAIAGQSGVHLYTRPGVLTWANNRFLTVHTGRAAPQVVLKSKKPVTWIEPFEKKVYARNTDHLTIDLEMGETKFFCLEENGEWQGLLK